MPKYEIATVAETVNGHDVDGTAKLAEEGVTLEIDGSQVIVTVRVQAENAHVALEKGRQIAQDVLLVLGTSHCGYRIQPSDPRDMIKRIDSVYQAEGPIPPPDVAEGFLSPQGADYFDPTGEDRRNGRVFRMRATGRATHSIVEDARLAGSRPLWTAPLKASLALYWEGQCSDNEYVRFILSMAALEPLAQPARFKSTDALLTYLNRWVLVGIGSGDPAFRDEVNCWQKLRNEYLHEGVMRPDSFAKRQRLISLVGACLRAEMDELLGTF